MIMVKPIKGEPNLLLRRTREWHSLSQQQVAECIGTTTLSVGRWERGLVLPGPHFRRALCALFNKNPYELGFMTPEHDLPELAKKGTSFQESSASRKKETNAKQADAMRERAS